MIVSRRCSWVFAAVVCGCGQQVDDGLLDPDPDPSPGSLEGSGSSSGSTGVADASTGISGSSSGESSSAVADTSGGSSGPDAIWDVGSPSETDTDTTACGDGNGGGNVGFSYIWVANSPESTVSKIDTQTMVELGRYLTRPDGAGDPSRTSVNLDGDVVVANRNGGITMIHARAEDCQDPDNTSSGPLDVKPWADGCIAWHTPLQYTTQRPIAWTQGTLNETTCRHEGAKVWTAGATQAEGSIEVLLLDGETGVVLEVVPIPEVAVSTYGLYGGAVDGNGDFWASQLNVGSLVRVRLDDLTHDSWPMPEVGYGMTVDHLGRPWTCNAKLARFDPGTEQWTVSPGGPGYGGAGCMEDGQGRMWVAGYAITGFDVDSMEEVANFPMPVMNGNPDTGYGRGISIDFDGYVWSPSHWSNAAYRLDPDSGQFEIVTGLNFPYTYSDMTGFALSNAGAPAG